MVAFIYQTTEHAQTSGDKLISAGEGGGEGREGGRGDGGREGALRP